MASPRVLLSSIELRDWGDIERVRQQLGETIREYRSAINTNAMTDEMNYYLQTVAAGTRLVHMAHIPKQVVGVQAALDTGTCTLRVERWDGTTATAMQWKSAAGAGLSVSTTPLLDAIRDPKGTDNGLMENEALRLVISAPAGSPAGLSVTLVTGQVRQYGR